MQLSTGDIRLVPYADNATVVILSPFRFKGGLSWDNPFIFCYGLTSKQVNFHVYCKFDSLTDEYRETVPALENDFKRWFICMYHFLSIKHVQNFQLSSEIEDAFRKICTNWKILQKRICN